MSLWCSEIVQVILDFFLCVWTCPTAISAIFFSPLTPHEKKKKRQRSWPEALIRRCSLRKSIFQCLTPSGKSYDRTDHMFTCYFCSTVFCCALSCWYSGKGPLLLIWRLRRLHFNGDEMSRPVYCAMLGHAREPQVLKTFEAVHYGVS